ncbi:transporter [Sphingomonas sp.]|uniref:transporter n=1 Tax=Sphingomonas sp. TaxID=28214 RepID=UPI0035BC2831
MRWALAIAAAVLVPVGAHAQDAAQAQDRGPRFCPTRPSLGESACVTEPGHVQVEVSAVDWTLAKDADAREDTVLAGDFLVRVGVSPTSELQVGWTPYGHVRTRDRATGAIEGDERVGDVVIGYRQNLRSPDGSGLSFGIEPRVTLPVGRSPVGAGTWGAALVVPVTYDLTDTLNIALTNEVDAAPDQDGRGRHFALNEVLGLGYDLTEKLTAVAELQVERERDPADHQTRALAAGSLAWQPRHGLQLDVLVGAGLNRDADDVRMLAGGAVGF